MYFAVKMDVITCVRVLYLVLSLIYKTKRSRIQLGKYMCIQRVTQELLSASLRNNIYCFAHMCLNQVG